MPLYTVNMESVPLHLLRITDRNLHRHVALGHIGSRLPTGEYREMRQQFSDPIWDGAITIADESNKLVTSQVPILRIIEGRKAWLDENPVPDDGTLLPHVSRPLPIGAALEGTYAADRVSYQSAPEFSGEAGLYALVTDSLDSPSNDKKEESGGSSEGETFCEEFCADSYVVQWIVRTDIGLAFYESPDRLHVVARSLATGEAVEGATIELVAANNRVLAEAKTDFHGVAVFARRLTEGTRGNRLAVVMARIGDDFSFIDFSADRLDLSRLGVFGRTAPGERNVFVYTDRGMYRPDDVVKLTVLMRDSAGLLPAAMSPIKVRLVAGETPLDEVDVARGDWQLGGVNVTLSIPQTARLGAAEIEVVDAGEGGETLAAATIQIDRLRPDRARIHYLDEPTWTAEAARDGRLSLSGTIAADYLFGDARVIGQAAAANLRSEVDVRIEGAETPAEGCYEGFSFGPATDPPPATVLGRIDGVTDTEGRLHFASASRPWTLPVTDQPARAAVTVTLFDNAGTVASRTRSIAVREDKDWIGVARNPALRPANADGAFVLGFDVVGVDGGNQALSPRQLSFKLFSERDVFVWEQRNGVWTSASDVAREEITAVWPDAEKTVQLVAGGGAVGDCIRPNATIETELPLGRYLLEVTDEVSGAKAATRFVTGSTTATIRDPEPNILEVASDRDRYTVGETAKLQVFAPFDGEVQVAIAKDDILEWVSGTTVNRVATVDVPIRQEWAGKGLYALVTVYRRQTDGTTVRGPARAIGTTYVEVAGEESNFDLTISAPLQARPDEPIKISACVSNGTTCQADFRQDGFVSLFAVDEGLISLTAHPVANPHGHYFGQVRLPIAIMDNYGRILLAEQGGDRPSRLALSNYTSDKIVSVLSGPVRLVNGSAVIELPKLGFDGSVRLVAIAWTADGVAADDETLTVSDSIVPRLDVPRFFTPGDKPVVPLVVSNREVGAGPYRVRIETPDGIDVASISDAHGSDIRDGAADSFSITLDRGATVMTYVSLDVAETLVADEVQLAVVIEELDIRRETVVPIRPPSPAILESVMMSLAPEQSVALADLTREFVAGRYNEAGLSLDTRVSGSGPITLLAPGMGGDDVETALLDRLVWTGMLLASQPDASADGRATRAKIAEIVRGVQALQARNGSFFPYRPIGDLVPQESEDPNRDIAYDENLETSLIFRTALAVDFLNAVSGKYDWKPTGGVVPVSLAVESKAVEFLAKVGTGWSCSPAGIYANLVLIPHGRIDDDDVQRIHRQCTSTTATPLAQAMMAAFFNEFGRSELGEEILVNFDVGSLAVGAAPTKMAMTLSFLVQAKAPDALLRAVYDELVALGVPRSVSLRDQVWLSRSALALEGGEDASAPSLEVTPDGFMRPIGETGGAVLTSGFVDYARIDTENIRIRNGGRDPLSLALVFEGFPTDAGSRDSATGNIRRRLFDRAGKELDPATAKIAVGDNLLIVVEGMSDHEDLAAQSEGMADLSPALIVADLLPSAFEILRADAFASEEGGPPPSLPRGVTPVGRLRSVNAGDDRLVAVVLPYELPEPAPGQPVAEPTAPAEPPPPVDFRIAYNVRVVSSGDFLMPATYVEPLAQPSTTVHSEPGRLSVERPAVP